MDVNIIDVFFFTFHRSVGVDWCDLLKIAVNAVNSDAESVDVKELKDRVRDTRTIARKEAEELLKQWPFYPDNEEKHKKAIEDYIDAAVAIYKQQTICGVQEIMVVFIKLYDLIISIYLLVLPSDGR